MYSVRILSVPEPMTCGPLMVVAFYRDSGKVAATTRFIESMERAEQVAAEYRRYYPEDPHND
jgi:hypothetical protein